MHTVMHRGRLKVRAEGCRRSVDTWMWLPEGCHGCVLLYVRLTSSLQSTGLQCCAVVTSCHCDTECVIVFAAAATKHQPRRSAPKSSRRSAQAAVTNQTQHAACMPSRLETGLIAGGAAIDMISASTSTQTVADTRMRRLTLRLQLGLGG
jgi:hypothetical protein